MINSGVPVGYLPGTYTVVWDLAESVSEIQEPHNEVQVTIKEFNPPQPMSRLVSKTLEKNLLVNVFDSIIEVKIAITPLKESKGIEDFSLFM